ncbi:serine hydrolase domain-containing protein [Streptomyces sp. NPDC091281]|uniref:serine hydrolase domain-containing protein n=1 Tax=Streptomyces sp. NPDC091281 TaxID=3365985 RepID=UPI00382FA1F5
MTAPAADTPWPGVAGEPPAPDLPRAADAPDWPARLAAAVAAVDAPDVVFAVSHHGTRTVRTGGTAPPPPDPRDGLRYELGSATKAFTGLLLADLVRDGRLTGGEAAVSCLRPGRDPGPTPVTLAHLLTHTSGLPALPAGFLPRALPAWRTNPYARYPAARVVDAFLRHGPRHRPGSRWGYSNYGVAVLGHALAAVTGTAWEDLVTERVLRPLALGGTGLWPLGPGLDAVGHGRDGRTPVPAFDPGGFAAAGAIRATPHDLLTFLEAHLAPPEGPSGELSEGSSEGLPAASLRAVLTPVLRRGIGHRHEHTVSWFRHPTPRGPMYFHSGATMGQQAFLGFAPGTGTALAALCTRRFRLRDTFVATAYALLADT